MNAFLLLSDRPQTLSEGLLSAQNPLSVSSPEADNSPAAEMASFQLDERLQVNLFADESHGIANPVCFEWDAHDRLWVLCTWAYPQVKPNARPNDKLIILEDRDGNGRADHSSVFMDGLDMPTGFALGHGGVYIGEGHDLIHAKDTDGATGRVIGGLKPRHRSREFVAVRRQVDSEVPPDWKSIG